jgi:hypothetical protein
MNAIDPDAALFTSTQVCVAARMSRGTFDAWLLRRYLSIPPGPGTGKVRKLSLVNAIRIAIVAELCRQGFPVSKAAAYVDQIDCELRATINAVNNSETVLMIADDENGQQHVWIDNEGSLTAFMSGYGGRHDAGHGRTMFYSVLLLADLISNVRQTLMEPI